MNLSVLVVDPVSTGSFGEELDDCINQVQAAKLGKRVISTTVFLNVRDNGEYDDRKARVKAALSRLEDEIFSVNYICQPPANGDQLAFELHLLNDPVVALERASYGDSVYVRAHSSGKLQGIFISGIQCDYTAGVEAAYEKVYSIMDEILSSEGLNFSNVVRQWNYIERILQEVKVEGLTRQHYQIFNDIRSKYYGRAEFNAGYPAATGIGCIAGGVTLSFYAIPDSPGTVIIPVDNPQQEPAFCYPDQVLVGEASVSFKSKTTPKFVRAKHIETVSGHITFISGTAAIRKEKTVAPDCVKTQLQVTLENIETLISLDNLKKSGVVELRQERIAYYRAYLKDNSNMEEIVHKCEELLPGIPNLFLISDICRKDLLIEIEAYAF